MEEIYCQHEMHNRERWDREKLPPLMFETFSIIDSKQHWALSHEMPLI